MGKMTKITQFAIVGLLGIIAGTEILDLTGGAGGWFFYFTIVLTVFGLFGSLLEPNPTRVIVKESHKLPESVDK